MVRRKKILIILCIAQAFLASAWLLWWTNNHIVPDHQYKNYADRIQKRVQKAIDRAAQEQEELIRRVRSSPDLNVSELASDYQYPTTCFRNNSMIFWSDHRFVPLLSETLPDSRYQYIIHNTGIYLYVKRSFEWKNDTISIVSALSIKKSFPIENNYLESGFNPEYFDWQTVQINNFHTSSTYEIKSKDGVYLFSADFDDFVQPMDWKVRAWVTVLGVAGILFLIYFVYLVVVNIRKQGNSGLSIMILFTMLVSLRCILLVFNIPFLVSEHELFDPRYFATSILAPSIGDFFINALLTAFFAWYLLRNYASVHWIKKIFHQTNTVKCVGIFICGVLLFLLSGYVFELFYLLYDSSRFTLDITQNIDTSFFKLVCLLSFVLICTTFFILNHIVFRVLILLIKGTEKQLWVIGLSVLSGFFIYLFLWNYDAGLFLLQVSFLAILYYFRIPYHLSRLNYSTYIYFLIIAFWCSFMAAHALYRQTQQKMIVEKHKYATQLLSENDHFGEYLLYEAALDIAEDKFIVNKLKNPFATKDVIVQKIKKRHLPDYLEKYDPIISVYDEEGNSYIDHGEYTTYQAALNLFNKNDYTTEYKNVFFLNEKGESPLKRYVSLMEIYDAGYLKGYIVIELIHKKNTSNSVYPELLVDKKFIHPGVSKDFQYAIFKGSELIVSSGSFNYFKFIQQEHLLSKQLTENGLVINDFHHVGSLTENGKMIIISSPAYYYKNAFSNFSFLLVLLVFFVLIFLIVNAYYFRFRGLHITYSTKIQIYLNIAFFLPLIIVSIVTLTLIGSGYRQALTQSFLYKAENLSANINGHLEEYSEDSMMTSRMEDDVAQLARSTDTDINLYGPDGKLMYSYHPAIYSGELLSEYMNSQAYSSLVEQNYNEVLLNESVGKLKYNAVYMAVRSFSSGKLLGIVSIPFFEAKQDFEEQLIGILTTILNIFSSIFILFLLMAWVASGILTVPLKLLTQKIRRTTFGGNKPLEWNSRDEIGMLVMEYNSMIKKLEESREALSRSEKESAWREMAKQVAHEIKNPLTPMKLTIQHLQRGWKEHPDDMQDKTVKSLGSLLDQVNILSEIASSFSAFAKMPIPKTERVDIAAVLKSTVQLYNANHEVRVRTELDAGSFIILGDGQLFGAIFNNLILNAIQAVPGDRTPEISIELNAISESVLIKISDNGGGIPESIREKVFLPNFTTKETGSGIGLAVAKRGVEHAGGRIWFETKMNAGTTFFIEVPLVM